MAVAGVGKRAPSPAFQVAERIFNTLLKLGVIAYLLAWALSFTSSRPLWNLPFAVAAVIAFRWLSRHVLVPPHGNGFDQDGCRSRRKGPRRYAPGSQRRDQMPPSGNDCGTNRDAWRRGVNAPIVESAWDSLCGSVVQEFVYDAWYMSLTPDREFPAEIRRLLNEAFSEVAQRARKIDLRTVLIRDMCDLVSEHLELYRSTRDGVGVLHEDDVTPAARDRAFQQEMKTEGTLHPGFCTRDGHYRVLQGIAEHIVSLTMSKSDLAHPYVKALTRELVATCMLRPFVMFFTRYNAARLILSMWPEELEQIQAKIAERLEQMVGKKELVSGHFEFEQRARKAAALEMKAGRKAKHRRNHTSPHLLRVHWQESSSAEDSSVDIQPLAWKCMSMEDLRGATGLQTAEIPSSRDDNASEASSVVTEQPSVMSEPLSARSVPASVLNGMCYRGMDPLSPRPLGTDNPAIAGQGKSSVHSAGGKLPDGQPAMFTGLARARVVAPEMKIDGSKEFVVFKIRVADQSGEWTVARRYRNFESLHKTLRDIPEYRCLSAKLPPKRYILHSNNTEFVEERRIALDKYLQAVLGSDVLSKHPEVFKFLSKDHRGVYQPDLDVSLLKAVVNNADTMKHCMKTALGNVIDEGKAHWKGRYKCSNGTMLTPRSSVHTLVGDDRVPPHWSTGHIQEDQSQPQQQAHITFTPAFCEGSASLPDGSCGSSPGSETSPWCKQHASESHMMFPSRREDMQDVKELESKPVIATLNGKASNGYPTETLARFLVPPNGRSSVNNVNNKELGRETVAVRQPAAVDDDDSETNWNAELADCTGISAPLYQVVESVFDMPAQKFFRRQMFQAVRQLLSLLAGDVIDVYLVERLKSLRTEHTIARLIHFIKSALWPGGKWFASLGPYAAARQAVNKGARPKGIQKEKFLEPMMQPPDEAEMTERLKHRLIIQAPPAFTSLVGRRTYQKGMRDIHDMLQLPTFLTQFGYGVLEIGLLALYPELRDFFSQIHREGIVPSGCDADSTFDF